MPRPIVLYASDHGFGHAMRLLALCEALRARDLPVVFCAGAALPAALPTLMRLGVTALEASLDCGLVAAADQLAVDDARSRAAARDWLRVLPLLIEKEAARLRALSAALVIADAPAAAIAAASEAGVPAVVCSNFSWLDLYGMDHGEDVRGALAGCYAKARLGLRLSPGRLPLQGIPRVREVPGMLGRPRRRSRQEVRAALGLAEEEPLLGLGLGRSFPPSLLADLMGDIRPNGARLLVPEGILPPSPAVVTFPAGDADQQDLLGAADVVLAKAGYATIAEAALCGVPLLLLTALGNRESVALSEQAAALGLAVPLSGIGEARRLLAQPKEALLRTRGLRPEPSAVRPAGPVIPEMLVEEGFISAGT